MAKRQNFLNKKPRSGRTTLTPDQAANFVEIYCKSKTYQEVSERLGRDMNEVMYTAQLMRANGIQLPYLKLHNETDAKVVSSQPPKHFSPSGD